MIEDRDDALLDTLGDAILASDPTLKYFLLLIRDCQSNPNVYISSMASNIGHDDLRSVLSDVLADDADESTEPPFMRRLDS